MGGNWHLEFTHNGYWTNFCDRTDRNLLPHARTEEEAMEQARRMWQSVLSEKGNQVRCPRVVYSRNLE